MNDNIEFPNEFYVGDSLIYEDYFSDFLPSDGWVADYVLLNGSNKVTLSNITHVTADVTKDKYIINVLTTTTDDYIFGTYNLSIMFSNSSLSKRITKNIKKVEIYKNLSVTTTLDNRNWAEIALENVTSVLQSKATIQQKMYEIAGRKLENHSPKEILELYNFLKSEVDKINNVKNKKGNNKIFVQFTNR